MARHPLGFVFTITIFLAGVSLPLGAAAQGEGEPSPAELEEARRIFGEALAHSDAREWHEAVAAFRQVMEVRAAPPVRFNLAVALVELGEYPEAEDLLTSVIEDAETDPQMRREARRLRGEMGAHGGELVVHFEGDPEGLVIALDDYHLAAEHIGDSHPVRPGAHEAVALRDGTVIDRRQVEVARGERIEVTLEAPDPAAAAEAANEGASDAAPAGSRYADQPLRRNPWFWVGVGGGAVLVITLTAIAASNDGGGAVSTGALGAPPLVRF